METMSPELAAEFVSLFGGLMIVVAIALVALAVVYLIQLF